MGRRGQKRRRNRKQTLDDLRLAKIEEMDMKVEDGKVTAYRARVNLSFRYTSEH